MKNQSDKTWVLIYEEDRVVSIIEPGLKTECGGIQHLIEFNTREKLEKYIIDNHLINKEQTIERKLH